MIENQNIRQILAIMVTDIVDYTETMNNDEQKAWDYLKKQRTLIPPMISKMNGHMFKEMGDGTFSKFKSAIDAVQCAVKIQEEAINNKLPIRIAVHLGDVMDDGVDVIGTGVNIASRINSMAKTGNIVISEDVWRQIRNQADMEATSMGQKEIKGFHQTVEVFELTYNPDGSITKKVKVTETVTVTDEEGKKVQAETAKKEFIKKVAIFPFDYDGDDENNYYLKYGFPFGCCISLLQDPLVEIEFPNDYHLRGDSFIEKLRKAGYEWGEGTPLPLKKKIAKELHCDYFIFGTISLIDNDFQITSKVYSSKNGKLVNKHTIRNPGYFHLIDEIAVQIRKDLGIPHSHIDEIENLPFGEITTESKDVYDQYIKGVIALEKENDHDESYKLLIEATKKDPTFAIANSLLSWSCFLSNNPEYESDRQKAINSAMSHIYKLPPRLAFLIKMYNYMLFKGEPDKAEKVVQMWIKQFPESLAPKKQLGWIYERQRKIDKAIQLYEEIFRNDPEYYYCYMDLQRCYLTLEDYDNALKHAEKYLEFCPSEAASYKIVGEIYSKKGDEETAKDYFEQALMLESDNIDYMVKIALSDLTLGNFQESESELEEALTYCKSNQDFTCVYNAKGKLFFFQGKINLSIECHEKSIEYLSLYTNPIDTLLSSIFFLEEYVLIGKQDVAIEKLKTETDKLIHPWNLLAGLGAVFVGGVSRDKQLVETGTKNFKEFLKIKDFGWIRTFSELGPGYIELIENNFKNAIIHFNTILKNDPQSKLMIVPLILTCHNNNEEFDNAKEIGIKFLKDDPLNPKILFELVKSFIGLNEIEKAKEYLTKLLNIWEDADEEFIYFQDAKKLWKEINTEKELA